MKMCHSTEGAKNDHKGGGGGGWRMDGAGVGIASDHVQDLVAKLVLLTFVLLWCCWSTNELLGKGKHWALLYVYCIVCVSTYG